MAITFEGYERRIDKINKVLAEYGINGLEDAQKICKDKGITTVIVSHDMPSVIRIADKIVYLREGTVYWTGTPEELLHSEDPVLKKFLYGDSGEDWASLAGMHENFQRVLLERAERERNQ